MEMTMLRFTLALIASTLLFSGLAHAKSLTYTIDHGTVGVITSKTEKVRLIIQAAGNCKSTPYSVVADSVLAASGNFDLSKKLSMPIDYTVLTLSCTDKAIIVTVDQANDSGPLGF
jgi:hypothetical protein